MVLWYLFAGDILISWESTGFSCQPKTIFSAQRLCLKAGMTRVDPSLRHIPLSQPRVTQMIHYRHYRYYRLDLNIFNLYWLDLPHTPDAGSSPANLRVSIHIPDEKSVPTITGHLGLLNQILVSSSLGWNFREKNPRHPVFRFHYHSQKVIGSLGSVT